MEEIQGFNIPQLRYEEDFNFLKKVLREATMHLNSEGDEAMVAAFSAAVSAFDEVLKLDTSNPFSSEVKASIEKTDQLWRGMRNQLKGMISFPDVAKAIIAEEAFKIVEKYGDITQMSQGERYGNLDNLTQDLRLIPQNDLKSINIDIWVEELEHSSKAYTNNYSLFTQEELKHTKGISKQRREEADDAYKLLVKRVNAKAITFEDGRHAVFIKNVNFLIDKEKTKLAARHTRAENSSKDGDDLPVDPPADPDLPA